MLQAFSEMVKTLAQRRGAACESEAVRATVSLTRGGGRVGLGEVETWHE